MKQLSVALLVIFSISLCSCKKEMNATPYPSQNLEGKWMLKTQSLKQYRNDVIYKDETIESSGSYLQFNSGGMGVVGSNAGEVTVKWNVLEEILTITKLFSNGQVLISPYHIDSFKGNTIVLRYEQSYTGSTDHQRYKDISVETYTR